MKKITAFDIVILGGGASAMMLAANLKDKNIAILEANSSLGKKVLISGGGKCNITNEHVNENNYLADADFVRFALDDFTNKETLSYFQSRGLAIENKLYQQYFCKNSAKELLALFEAELQHVKTFFSTLVKGVEKKEGLFYIQTNTKEFVAKKVVVATGGKSYEKIGASDIGLRIAKSFGLEVQEFAPALVGFTVQKEQFWFKELSGISCMAKVSVGEKHFCKEVLFTHKGLSGPAILSASLYWQKGQISIDFLPDAPLHTYLEGKKTA